jgi:hypothetical protein
MQKQQWEKKADLQTPLKAQRKRPSKEKFSLVLFDNKKFSFSLCFSS